MRHTGLGGLLDGLSATHNGTSATLGCKKLLLSTILVTDMSVHDQFMRDFAELVERGVDPADHFKAKVLACQALIKCADISNPVSIIAKLSCIFTSDHSLAYYRHDLTLSLNIGPLHFPRSGRRRWSWRNISTFHRVFIPL